MYDFPSDADGVAIPYGIYDVTRGDGFVVGGTSHNTPAFAAVYKRHPYVVARRGPYLYSTAKELLILAESVSSNGVRAHDWKRRLQEIANKTGLRITVAHYPTGASKWNPVEHRLFGPISINWAGEPLVDYNTICQRIRHTRTRSGACWSRSWKQTMRTTSFMCLSCVWMPGVETIMHSRDRRSTRARYLGGPLPRIPRVFQSRELLTT